LDNANSGFSRDAFGRQSMSEKRHATLDAKNTDTYQRNKKLREERGDDTKSRKYYTNLYCVCNFIFISI
jgi:partitioning defective protein 3